MRLHLLGPIGQEHGRDRRYSYWAKQSSYGTRGCSRFYRQRPTAYGSCSQQKSGKSLRANSARGHTNVQSAGDDIESAYGLSAMRSS